MLERLVNQTIYKCHPFIGIIIATLIIISIILIIIGLVITKGKEKLRGNELKEIGDQIGFMSKEKLDKGEVLKTVKKCVKLYEDDGSPPRSKSKIRIYNILEGGYKGNNLVVFDMKTVSDDTLYSSPFYDTIIWTEVKDCAIPDFDLFNANSSVISDAVINHVILPFLKLFGYKSPQGEIKVSNEEFSKKYKLYANDESNLKIFSPAVMEYFTKKNFKFNISARDNRIVVYPYSSYQHPIQPKNLLLFIDKASEAISVIKQAQRQNI